MILQNRFYAYYTFKTPTIVMSAIYPQNVKTKQKTEGRIFIQRNLLLTCRFLVKTKYGQKCMIFQTLSPVTESSDSFYTNRYRTRGGLNLPFKTKQN